MNEELKPCPFCGCLSIDVEQTSKNGVTIKCTHCLMGYKQKVLSQSIDWLKGVMIKKWNTRNLPL